MPQPSQAATVRPSASAGAACSKPLISGAIPTISFGIDSISTGGAQGANHSGNTRLPAAVAAPDTAPERAPAFDTVQTATACSAQAAKDHETNITKITNQLSA